MNNNKIIIIIIIIIITDYAVTIFTGIVLFIEI